MAEVVNVRIETVSFSARVAPIDEETGHENINQQSLPLQNSELPSTQGFESWLPITESRKGNAFTAALHLLCSGIGVQTLVLPVAFVALGWPWGIVILCVTFLWQTYTTWVLVHLHESESGIRYSRFLHLSIVAFGPKLGKLLAIFPTMYLSGATCVMFIINGGWIMELFFKVISCGDNLQCNDKTLTGAQWFLVFACLSILLSQFFPNLNSLSRVSFIGSIMVITYCSMIWILSVSKGPEKGISHDPSEASTSDMVRIRNALNGIGFIALVFRGHNVVLEIQGTIRSNQKRPSRVPMWRGVTISCLLVALCLFPIAIVGYWAYGNSIPSNGGILSALVMFHKNNTSKFVIGTICLTMLIHYICAFQIYAMVVFDNLERLYVTKKNEPCPRWIRSAIRVFYGGFTYFISVAFPFLGSLGLFIGAIVLPLTLSYPCFMWIVMKKPRALSRMWCLNVGLGSLGVLFSVVLFVSSLSTLIANGLDANFFKPK